MKCIWIWKLLLKNCFLFKKFLLIFVKHGPVRNLIEAKIRQKSCSRSIQSARHEPSPNDSLFDWKNSVLSQHLLWKWHMIELVKWQPLPDLKPKYICVCVESLLALWTQLCFPVTTAQAFVKTWQKIKTRTYTLYSL